MKKLLLTSLFLFFFISSYSQSGKKVTIYNTFYMEQVRPYPILDLSPECRHPGNFILKITLDRTGQECVVKPYWDAALNKYVFPLKPMWPDVRESDMFTVVIHIEYGTAEFMSSTAYAGLINPKYEGRYFTAKATAIALSGISKGIPLLTPYLRETSRN